MSESSSTLELLRPDLDHPADNAVGRNDAGISVYAVSRALVDQNGFKPARRVAADNFSRQHFVLEFFPENEQVPQPFVFVGLLPQQLVFYGQLIDALFQSDVFIMQPDEKKIMIPGAADGIDALVGYAQGKGKQGKNDAVKKRVFFFLLYAFGKKGERSQQERSNEKRFFVSKKKLLHV